MNILAITDIHGNISAIQRIFRNEVQDVDIILICGDITHFGSIPKTEEVLKEITRYNVPTYFVPGNCDNKSLLNMEELAGAINIHGKVVRFEELAIAGVGGSPVTPFNTNIELSEDEFETIIQKLKKDILPNNWVLCAHSPPFRTVLDKLFNEEHAGSKVIYNFIKKEKPIVSIHGHIHEARGIDRIGGVPIVNPGPARSKYYAIISISSSSSEIKIDLKRAR